jgi:outer membrane receptor protein involved in Fe transport
MLRGALATALCAMSCMPCMADGFRDLTLEQALRELKRGGLSILYSSDLVKPEMRVQVEPGADDLRGILDEIASPHGLAVTEGPRGYLMLARARPGGERTGQAPNRTPFRGDPAETADLAEIIVTASHYELLREPEASLRSFSAADLQLMPDIGEDPLRAVTRLPGVAGGDLSAKANFRGGESDESLILFDGLRLFNPFHFKDFHSVFSAIDPGLIDGMRIYTGGFPAAYGDRMSGVIDIAPLAPKEQMHREVSLSFFNASALVAGRFDDGEGDWLLSARRGHPDLILDLADPQLGTPGYIDLHGRVRKRLSDALAASASVLVFDDRLTIADSDQEEQARADYGDRYFWLRFDYAASGALMGNLMLARTELDSSREGRVDQPGISRGELNDQRAFTIHSLQTDWSWRLAERMLAQFGSEWRIGAGTYAYTDSVEFDMLFVTPGASLEPVRSRSFSSRPSGDQYGAYLNLRFEPLAALTLDAGLRWDKETFSSDNADQVSPRIGLRYRIHPRTELRASWGRYLQSQAVNELQISDGVERFEPAQRSDHLIASVEYRRPSGTELRLEAYRKNYRELRPRFENLLNTFVLLPELKPDRIRVAPERAIAKGMELTLRRTEPEAVNWWASYTWASVEDDDGPIEALRTWDQRHFISAGLAWQGPLWELSLAGIFHTGRPTTAVEFVPADPVPRVIAGPRNGESLRDYLAIDGRIARKIALQSTDLTVFLEVRNLTNRRNDCCIEYEIGDEEDAGMFELETLGYPSIFPSLGFAWRF